MKWYDDYQNLTALGAWLLETYLFDAEALQHYYEKPWHYEDEWEKYLKTPDGAWAHAYA